MKDDNDGVFKFVLIIVIMTTFTIFYWKNKGMINMEKQAVKVGHARYIVDNVGRVSFEWLATQTAEIK